MRDHLEMLGMKSDMISRSLNEGFSGGEKKRNEILQMLILEPEVIILDEIDSGLDIDALRAVSEGINKMKDGKRSFLVITHYSRILDYIEPDYIHVLKDGRIIKTAGPELVAQLEEHGYDGYRGGVMNLLELKNKNRQEVAELLGVKEREMLAERFVSLGLPSKKSEEYRYFDVEKLLEKVEYKTLNYVPKTPKVSDKIEIVDGVVVAAPQGMRVYKEACQMIDMNHFDPLYYVGHMLSPETIKNRARW